MATIRMPPRQAAQGPGVMSPPYAQPAPQGTLAPGTRIMVGPIVVTVQKYLSQGGFAHVYLVTTDKPIPMPVSATSDPGATKSTSRGETLHVLKRMAVPDKEALAGVRGEVEVHRSLRSHANIVHFIEASATALQGGGYEIFILMEYCSGGGIIDLMNARLRTRLSEAEVLKIFGDVAAGLSVMHGMSPPLMHRDLKVENILLAPPPRSNPSAGPTYKLCDFGSTKAIKSRQPPQTLEEVKEIEADLNKCTTLQYRAPEMVDVYQRRVIDEKADIWAMGVLLYKLCYYTTPFEENGGGPLAILNARYRFPHSPPYSQRLKDLIASMLQERSDSRPSIDQILLKVHHMLGTQPPASVLQKVKAASNGAHASPQRSYATDPRSGSNADLLQKAPSQDEQRRLEAEEAKKRSDAITPMRRGRPNRDSGLTSAAAKYEPASPGASVGGSLQTPLSPLKSPLSTTKPSSSLGFTDSFTPSSDTKAYEPGTRAEEPSRPSSVLDHSPSLPGFDASSRLGSARASPLPPPVKSASPPIQTSHVPASKSTAPQTSSAATTEADEEAKDRFPSVEELDRKYPISALKPPSKASVAQSIPGLSDRPSVSAMTDRFGSMAVKRASAPVPAKSATGSTTKKATTNVVGQRWPHSGSDTSPITSNGTEQRSTVSVTSPPSLPSRKHDWLRSDQRTAREDRKQSVDAKEAVSSDEEQEEPEDLDAPSKLASAPQAVPQSKTATLQDVILKEAQSDDPMAKVVATTDELVSTTVPASSREAVPVLQSSQSYAPPPAWDEDDEEMHFLPQPTINSADSAPKSAGARSFKNDSVQQKVYADASTSPIGRSPSPSIPERQEQRKQDVTVLQRPQPPIVSPKPSYLAKVSNDTLLEKAVEISTSSTNAKPTPPVKPSGIRARQDTSEAMNASKTLPTPSRQPPVVAPKPSNVARGNSISAVQERGKVLKPWEREAMEKERVQMYGSLRSQSPQKKGDGVVVQSTPVSQTKAKGEAQERFQGVSSLISQWQNNAARGAPGWGTVGLSTGAASDRVSSKDEDSLYRNTASKVQGRLPSREV
jgi:AP2-associated kinase